MKSSSKFARKLAGLTLVMAALTGWLALSGLPLHRTSSANAGRVGFITQGSGLDPARESALQKLVLQLKAGAPFSEEEADILRKFSAGATISVLEADTVISRALYDYYITGNELSREQQELLGRYQAAVARRETDIADLKTRLLNERKAAELAAPPRAPQVAPGNDLCSGAVGIPGAGPFPFCAATVADITDATTTGDPPAPSCQTSVSRSIWYTFNPASTATYTLTTCQSDGNATTVDDTVMAIYTSTGGCAGPFTEIPSSGLSDGCDDDTCVNEVLQSVITTQLNAGTQYFIVIWQFSTTPPSAGNTAVHLCVKQQVVPANDTCASAATIGANAKVSGTTIGAFDTYQAPAACFTGLNQTPVSAAGRDVVYKFTAPTAGTYSIRVNNHSPITNLVLYATNSCPAGSPPILVSGCLGAANRSATSTSEEIPCLSLAAGQQIFIYVDEETLAPDSGSSFTLEVSNCTQESGSNDTPGTANLLVFGIQGSINPGTDVDFFSLGTPAAGSRVFALVDGNPSFTTDYDLRVTTSTDTLEYDDLNADSPFGSSSGTVGGTPLTGAPSFLRVNHFANQPAEPYRLYAVVQPPIASATAESEPNNTIATGDTAVNNYFTGSLAGPAPSTDIDIFCFTATVGDVVFLGLDADPLRNNTPINAALALLDSTGAELISVNDGGSTSNTTPSPGTLSGSTPTSPAESLVFRVTTTGNFYARVSIGTASSGSTGAGDYLLSIAKGSTGPTAAKMESFTAQGYAGGKVLLRWQTGQEVDNLGFRIYREEGNQFSRVTPRIIAGSALLAGPGTSLLAGQSYAWADSLSTGGQPARYWLEDIDLNGQSTWHGPIEVDRSAAGKKLRGARSSELLSRVGRDESAESLTLPVEQAARLAVVAPAAAAEQSGLASQPAVKVSVKNEGWYRLSQQELAAAGLASNVNPLHLQLYVDGQQVPIAVTGDKDGRLDPQDTLEFYGQGLDTALTDARTYWLVAGASPGLRVSLSQETGAAAATTSFRYTVERRDRLVYFSSLRNGETENFFGAVVGRDPVDQSLTLQHLGSAAGPATLEVALQGVTLATHTVNVAVNGTPVGAVSFDGQSRGVAQLQLSQGLLREGVNQVALRAQGGDGDVSLVDHLRLTYWHSYQADNNALRLTAAGKQQVTIDGFTSSQIRVLDVTNPAMVQELAAVVKPNKGAFSVTATSPAGTQRTLLAVASDQARRAAAVKANNVSNWRSPSQAADLVIIAHASLMASLDPLKALRQGQGLGVVVIDVEDLFDEFSYGHRSTEAIRDFLAYARSNWQRAPRFVLLAGDSSVDAKNYLGRGEFDLVPTRLIDTEFLETATDDWYADFDGNSIADIAVGRLPVRGPAEAAVMVRKIISYEQAPVSSEVMLVADASEGYNFPVANTQLRQWIPPTLSVEEINRGQMDPAKEKARLIAGINRGQKVVSYTGHGSVGLWRGSLLTTDEARALGNGNRLGLFVMMTCLNGYFEDASLDSLAEGLMKAEGGGAVAVWASSGMTEPGEQAMMNSQLFRLLFNPASGLTVGEATLKAKAAITGNDIRRTWVLFGDPTMRLR